MNSEQFLNPAGSAGRGVSRRSFLAAGLAIPLVIPRHVLGGLPAVHSRLGRRSLTDWAGGHRISALSEAEGDTLTIACVGVGGMGRNYLDGCKDERFVALCDLDHNFVNSRGVFDRYPDARRYHDFREMFDKEANNFDALIVATPDHTHTVILMPALQLGKHIYCAKPVIHNYRERVVRKQ